MANQSIFDAFERMWHHILNKLSYKSDIGHKHKIDDITDLENSSNVFYVNCTNISFDDSYTDGLRWKISSDKTFNEIKTAIKEGKTPVATFTWLENNIVLASFTLTQYTTDIDGDFIYFNGTSSDYLNGNVSNLKITICNPNPTYVHDITENIFTSITLELDTSLEQPDWGQNNPAAADYIKNRTHYMSDGAFSFYCSSYLDYKANSIPFNSGNTTLSVIKLSDTILTEEQMQNINTSITICTDLITPQTFDCTEKAISTLEDGSIMGMYMPPPVEGEEEDDSMMAATIVFSVPENAQIEGVTIEEGGTYAINVFMLMIDQLSNDPDFSSMIEIYNMMFRSWEISYGNIKQLNTAFIPASIARTSGIYTKTEGNLLREEFDNHTHSYNSLTDKPFYDDKQILLEWDESIRGEEYPLSSYEYQDPDDENETIFDTAYQIYTQPLAYSDILNSTAIFSVNGLDREVKITKDIILYGSEYEWIIDLKNTEIGQDIISRLDESSYHFVPGYYMPNSSAGVYLRNKYNVHLKQIVKYIIKQIDEKYLPDHNHKYINYRDDKMYFEGALSYSFDNNLRSAKNVYSNGKISVGDGVAGCFLGAGNTYLQASNPSIRFMQIGNIDTNNPDAKIWLSENDNMYFDGATDYYFDNNLRSAKNVYSNGKVSVGDGTSGCFLGEGHVYLQTSNPGVRFMLTGNTDIDNPDAKIWLSSNDKMYFEGSQGYNFDSRITLSQNLYTNNKTSSTDGITGCLVANSGNIHMQGASPSAYFYLEGATSPTSYIRLIKDNTDNLNYMNFKHASGYTFDNKVVATDFYTGNKTSPTDINTGGVLTSSGILHLRAKDNLPSIRFYYGDDDTNTNGRVAVNSSNYMLFNYSSLYDFDNAVRSTGAVSSGGKTNYNDGVKGGILGQNGRIYLQGTEPGLLFYIDSSTASNCTIIANKGTVESLTFNGADLYDFTDNVKSSKGFYSYGKESYQDGKAGIVMGEGWLDICGKSNTNSSTGIDYPSVRFYKNGSTSPDGKIYLNSYTNNMEFSGITGTYNFDKDIKIGGTGVKAFINKFGVVVTENKTTNSNGNIAVGRDATKYIILAASFTLADGSTCNCSTYTNGGDMSIHVASNSGTALASKTGTLRYIYYTI